jgi:hypothetical protein
MIGRWLPRIPFDGQEVKNRKNTHSLHEPAGSS